MTKAAIIPIALTWGASSLVYGVNLEKLASEAATIKAVVMNPVDLETGEGKKAWIEIPELLDVHNATIFEPDRDQLGVAEFRVTKGGYVLLACNFDYQGNPSGGWVDEALSKEEFRRMGWREIRKPKKIGGLLVQSDKRVQTIFFKKVHRGEYFNLRCNKYDPPYPILLGGSSQDSESDPNSPSKRRP